MTTDELLAWARGVLDLVREPDNARQLAAAVLALHDSADLWRRGAQSHRLERDQATARAEAAEARLAEWIQAVGQMHARACPTTVVQPDKSLAMAEEVCARLAEVERERDDARRNESAAIDSAERDARQRAAAEARLAEAMEGVQKQENALMRVVQLLGCPHRPGCADHCECAVNLANGAVTDLAGLRARLAEVERERNEWQRSHSLALHAEDDARRARDAAESDAKALRGALREAVEFYAETGFIRPGKDVPLAMGGYDEEARGAAWDAWVKKKRDALEAKARAALAGKGSTEG